MRPQSSLKAWLVLFIYSKMQSTLKRLKWSSSRLIFFNVLLALDMILCHDFNNNETGIPKLAEEMASV